MKANRLVAFGISATLLAGSALSAAQTPAAASSHREAPLISMDPAADNTDTYAFISPDRPDSVTLIGSWIPGELPQGGPNYYGFANDVTYKLYVDNNGDATPDKTYEFKFNTTVRNPLTFLYNVGPINSIDDPNFNMPTTYTMTEWTGVTMTLQQTGLKVAPATSAANPTRTTAKSGSRPSTAWRRPMATSRSSPARRMTRFGLILARCLTCSPCAARSRPSVMPRA